MHLLCQTGIFAGGVNADEEKKLAGVLVILCIVAAVFGYYLYRMWPMLSTTMGSVELTEEHQSHEVDEADGDSSTVYMTTDISPEGLMRAYEALGVTLNGDHIAVKLSPGEPGSNYLDPDLIADLIHEVNGTIVECNTAYQGSRTETQMHYQVAEDHGYTEIADVVIMDEDGASLVNRMESRNAEHVLEHGEEVGLGNGSYELVSIDE